MRLKSLFVILIASITVLSCTGMEESEERLSSLEDRVADLESGSGASHMDAETLKKLVDGALLVVGVSEDGSTIELSDGTSCDVTVADLFDSVLYDEAGGVLKIVLGNGQEVVLPVVTTFYLDVKDYADGAVVAPGETLTYEVEMSEVADAVFHVPDGWTATLSQTQMQVTPATNVPLGNAEIGLTLVSDKGMMRVMNFRFVVAKKYDPALCKIYNDFVLDTEDNILVDFSYAGYDHGESAPPEVSALGWKTYDVTDYGAIANDGKSDREAFLKCLEAATGTQRKVQTSNVSIGNKGNANAVIYFPDGEYILHTEEDDYTDENEVRCSRAIQIAAGNIVIKGAGRDRTTIVMQSATLPTDPADLDSSPLMIQIKHLNDREALTPVTANSAKGSFSVTVADASGLKVGDRVCLSMLNNDPACIAAEFGEVERLSTMTTIASKGIEVLDYHQIKAIDGNVITFYEPLMHEVDISYTGFSGADQHNWRINKWPHLEHVGVEDITFKGNAKSGFVHHGDYDYDGGYKMLLLMRTADSWIRRVRFTSASIGASFSASANVSVYDVEFDGNRGHAAVRAYASTRLFIGAVKDRSTGASGDSEGQFHGTGVAKNALGTVLWRNEYGSDSSFESHCEQPRATLSDCCKGGFQHGRAGGSNVNTPHHLDDLVLWNYNVTTAPTGGVRDFWCLLNYMLPPVVVGMHGESVTLQNVKVDDSHGVPVAPESLYEAQLRNRLGHVPGWLEALK